MTATKFKSLKERLTFVLHVLKESPCPPGTGERTELVLALLSADDLRDAQQIRAKYEKGKGPQKPAWLSWLPSPKLPFLTWSKPTDEKSLQKEETLIKSDISDSDFLRELKDIQDTDLADPIHEAFALVYSHLSSLIDTTVNKATRAVLRMQQNERQKIVKGENEEEESRALGHIAANFIRDVNQNSSGKATS